MLDCVCVGVGRVYGIVACPCVSVICEMMASMTGRMYLTSLVGIQKASEDEAAVEVRPVVSQYVSSVCWMLGAH